MDIEYVDIVTGFILSSIYVANIVLTYAPPWSWEGIGKVKRLGKLASWYKHFIRVSQYQRILYQRKG